PRHRRLQVRPGRDRLRLCGGWSERSGADEARTFEEIAATDGRLIVAAFRHGVLLPRRAPDGARRGIVVAKSRPGPESRQGREATPATHEFAAIHAVMPAACGVTPSTFRRSGARTVPRPQACGRSVPVRTNAGAAPR